MERADGRELLVRWLDADFAEIERPLPTATLAAQGRTALEGAAAPLGATYAVPTVFKDGDRSTLVVDELVFGLTDGACGDAG